MGGGRRRRPPLMGEVPKSSEVQPWGADSLTCLQKGWHTEARAGEILSGGVTSPEVLLLTGQGP